MDRTVLHLAGQPGVTRYEPGSQNGLHHVKLSLPADMTCEQCVLQWRYKAGNSNNCDKYTNECCKGCGAQESFVNCADIAIDADSVTSSKPVPTTTQQPQTTKKDTTVASTTSPIPATTMKPTTMEPTTKSPSTTTQASPTTTPQPSPTTTPQPSPTTTPQPPPTTTPQPSPTQQDVTLGPHITSCAADEVIDCLGVGVYEGLGYESWCNSYCGGGSPGCTSDLCHCTCKKKITCVAIGDYASRPGMDEWCTNTCQNGCDHLQNTCSCS